MFAVLSGGNYWYLGVLLVNHPQFSKSGEAGARRILVSVSTTEHRLDKEKRKDYAKMIVLISKNTGKPLLGARI